MRALIFKLCLFCFVGTNLALPISNDISESSADLSGPTSPTPSDYPFSNEVAYDEPPSSRTCDEADSPPVRCTSDHIQTQGEEENTHHLQRRGRIPGISDLLHFAKDAAKKTGKNIADFLDGYHPKPTPPEEMHGILSELPATQIGGRAEKAKKTVDQELDAEYKSRNPDASHLLQVRSCLDNLASLSGILGNVAAHDLLKAAMANPSSENLWRVVALSPDPRVLERVNGPERVKYDRDIKIMSRCMGNSYAKQWYQAILGVS